MKSSIPFTVIIPVLNENKNIRTVLDALYKQTLTPNEIIVADWWSTDGTREFLQQEEKEWLIKLIKSGNIAKSRNDAISIAKNELILCTDAWCVIENNRCEEHVKMYEDEDTHVVWWKSEVITDTLFKQKAKELLIPNNSTFASSRNISFYKKVWEDVWWYPEYLTLCWEDTYFNYKIEKKWYTIKFCPTAKVYWWWRNSFSQVYRMLRNYLQWDAEILMIHWIIQSMQIKQLFTYIIGLIVAILCIIFFKRYAVIAFIILALCIFAIKGRWKKDLWFRLRFTLAQKLWIFVGFFKWLYTGFKIKKELKNKDLTIS